jgi:lipopolysaccharide transport system ATP-binding protein
MKPILEINQVSKRFLIQHQNNHSQLRDRIMNTFRSAPSPEEFWALRDVSCSVARGESIGIIGKNGAGKSTLLKILSRITPPTGGHIITRGRIASLLEVGTGFHHELTGRENIYLNGSILGMKRREIDRQFDAIVDFAGTAKFLDTPLKHYSSGMQLRLAFAVAAFLEPEILIIDEVLAVGDAEFQRKCMGKMEDVTHQGRTILFVSHNMTAVKRLCNKCMVLDNGHLAYLGDTNEAISRYTFANQSMDRVVFDHPVVKSVTFALVNQALEFRIALDNYAFRKPPSVGFVISDLMSNKVMGTNPTFSDSPLSPASFASGTVVVRIRQPKLRNGYYKLSLWIGDGQADFFEAEDCLEFNVEGMISERLHPELTTVGSVFPETTWEIVA